MFLVPENGFLNTNLSLKLEKISKMNELLLYKSPVWAAQNKERGHQFDMPALYLTLAGRLANQCMPSKIGIKTNELTKPIMC